MEKIKITGKVVHGDNYGKRLGFPTANLDRRQFAGLKKKPRLGVWSGRVKLGLKLYPAAVVVGPLDKKALPKLEVHLIGFKGNLYGKKITFVLGKYIRPFRKFKSEAELKKQISLDVNKIRELLR